MFKDCLVYKIVFEEIGGLSVDKRTFEKTEQFGTYYIVKVLDGIQIYDANKWTYKERS